MNRVIFIIGILVSFHLKAQDGIKYNVVKSIDPSFKDDSDLKELDSIFSDRKIIGIGESTHGTSEFTTMRHRLFKYLVENHGYNTFILEADFGACQRLNRYIHGENDSVKNALREVRLWPWLTEEMVDLIEWMRSYNLEHNNTIEFIGCDMQMIEDDLLELKRFFLRTNPSDTVQMDFLLTLKRPYKDTASLKSAIAKWELFHSTYSKEKLNSKEKMNYTFLKSTIDQWFENQIGMGNKYNFRDSCMAVNMVNYLQLNPTAKGIYFAHNGHVSKKTGEYKNYSTIKKTGKFLAEKLGIEYFVILQELDKGVCTAINLEKSELDTFRLEPSKKKTMGFILNKCNTSLLFCSVDQLPRFRRIQMTSIGATYGKDKTNHPIDRYQFYYKDEFDAFLFIRNTTASHPFF